MHKNEDKYYKLLMKLLSVYKAGGVLLVSMAFIILLVNFSPSIWYTVDAGAVDSNTDVLLDSIGDHSLLKKINEDDYKIVNGEVVNTQYSVARKLPDKDPSLPKQPTLIIKKVGINAVIHRGTDGDSELDKGVWMPPEFKNPVDANYEPIMLLAHRFGYLSWSNEFRKTNSFYNLPKLEAGDEITIVWDQRPFKYKVADKYEASGSINSSNDLILYTCKFFRSKDRIVVTADRIN